MLIALAITIIVPVAWVFMVSVKQNSEFYGNPFSLPQGQKKEPIVVDKAPTKEEVEKLGKQLDKLKAEEKKTTDSNNNK